MLHFLYNIFQKCQFLERILLYINKVSLYTLNTYVFIKACKLDNNITNRYKFNSTTQNSSNINFKQKLSKKAEKVISEEALTVASAAATALGIATISLSKNNNEVKKFDHEALAVLIREKIGQGKQHKQICEELGIEYSKMSKIKEIIGMNLIKLGVDPSLILKSIAVADDTWRNYGLRKPK